MYDGPTLHIANPAQQLLIIHSGKDKIISYNFLKQLGGQDNLILHFVTFG